MTDAPAWMAPGRARVSPFLICAHADAVIAFAEDVFGFAHLRPPLRRGDGTLWNAEMTLGDGSILIGGAMDGFVRPGFVYVHVEDAHATYARALEHGARPVQPVEERFYGDLDGGVEDVAGNLWWIATHMRDLSDDEIEAGARDEERRRRETT